MNENKEEPYFFLQVETNSSFLQEQKGYSHDDSISGLSANTGCSQLFVPGCGLSKKYQDAPDPCFSKLKHDLALENPESPMIKKVSTHVCQILKTATLEKIWKVA